MEFYFFLSNLDFLEVILGLTIYIWTHQNLLQSYTYLIPMRSKNITPISPYQIYPIFVLLLLYILHLEVLQTQ